MSTAVICEGCGRPAGERELYCPACGRELPGREAPASSDAAPAGWLVATGARGEGGYFEPLPAVPVRTGDALGSRSAWPGKAQAPAPARWTSLSGTLSLQDGPSWRVRERRGAAPPPPLPAASACAEGTPGAGDAALVAAERRPPLRVLYVPLVALILLSSGGAVALLVLHALLHR